MHAEVQFLPLRWLGNAGNTEYETGPEPATSPEHTGIKRSEI